MRLRGKRHLAARAAAWLSMGFLLAGQVAAAVPASLGSEGGQALVLADFDDIQQYAQRRNAHGGAFEVWCVSAECSCTAERVEEDALGHPRGGALRLRYSVRPTPHFNGWYMFLSSDQAQGLDLSVYDRLGFFVKGATSFTVEIKDLTSKDDGTPAGVAEYVVGTKGQAWQRI